MTSLPNFKETLKEKLLELHWQQWNSLGVSSHTGETKYIIDLEALIISSLAIGDSDKRFLSAVLEWIKKNKEWVSVSRLKQVGKNFLQVDNKLGKTVIGKESFEFVLLLLLGKDINKIPPNLNNRNLIRKYRDILSNFEERNVTVQPVIKKKSLLQLFFRGIFGVNARTEIILYLLLQKKGNSNQIAREIFYDQKIVYRILKKWTMSGFVEKVIGNNEILYSLKNDLPFFKNVKPRTNYFNWSRIFYLFALLFHFVNKEPWKDDVYLMSSLFRDIAQETAVVAKYFGVSLPDESLYRGEEFFFPFASALLKIAGRMVS